MWSQCRLAAIVKLFPGCHAEAQEGSDDEAEEYCTKERTRELGPWRVGVRDEVGQGARTDIHRMVADIQRGATMTQIAEAHPAAYLKFSRGAQNLRAALQKHRTEKPLVFGYVGGAGIGKTKAAVDYCTARGLSYWIHPGGGKWFDGYENQDVVILDEIDKWAKDFTFAKVLRLLDRYHMSVEIKGGTVIFNSRVIIFTATNPPESWITDPGQGAPPREQIERRIDHMWTRVDINQPWIAMDLFRPAKEVEHVQQVELVDLISEEEEEIPAGQPVASAEEENFEDTYVVDENGFVWSQ